jgi:hypothetical protein
MDLTKEEILAKRPKIEDFVHDKNRTATQCHFRYHKALIKYADLLEQSLTAVASVGSDLLLAVRLRDAYNDYVTILSEEISDISKLLPQHKQAERAMLSEFRFKQ